MDFLRNKFSTPPEANIDRIAATERVDFFPQFLGVIHRLIIDGHNIVARFNPNAVGGPLPECIDHADTRTRRRSDQYAEFGRMMIGVHRIAGWIALFLAP